MTSTPQFPTIRVGGAQIHAQNVQLRSDLRVDELHLEGGDIVVEPSGEAGAPPRVTTGETRIRAVVSEPNLNTLLAANAPAEAPVRNLRIAVLSGRVRLSMNTVGVLSLPLSMEAVPRIENGIRVLMDWQGVQVAGIGLPHQLVEVIEQKLSKTLDLSQSPIPIWLEEIRCEPGRVTVFARARVAWPPAPLVTTHAFTGGASSEPSTVSALPVSSDAPTSLPASESASETDVAPI